MSSIVRFSSKQELDDFLKPKLIRKVGFGYEGTIYTDEKDAYKVFDKDCPVNEIYIDFPEGIITTDQIDIPSFVFPDELYVIRLRLCALKCRLIRYNYFDKWSERKTLDDFRKLDFDLFISSIDKLEKDIKLITDEKIVISDLPGNLMFDGKSLIGVDTGFFHKASIIEVPRIGKSNLLQGREAVAYFFRCLCLDYPELSKYFKNITLKTDIIKGIEKVRRMVR